MPEDEKLRKILQNLHLGGWQYYQEAASTNDIALAWAHEGAPDWSLVLADSQTAGRGRAGRRWITQPGVALAMSVVVRPESSFLAYLPRFTGLAALGLIGALGRLGLQGKLKWPNDVLLEGKKVAGVLVEADWEGQVLDALVVGMGVNVALGSLPDPDKVRYPATSVETVLGQALDRWALLGWILGEMRTLQQELPEEGFLKAWNSALAFRGAWVRFTPAGQEPQDVKILGVAESGALVFEDKAGRQESALAGEIVMSYN